MENNELKEKLVYINRITKVVKGGRRFGFSALVVVGNQNGKIGLAHAKAKQVPDAIRKASEMAKRNLTHILYIMMLLVKMDQEKFCCALLQREQVLLQEDQ